MNSTLTKRDLSVLKLKASSRIRRILDKARAGERISQEEGVVLLRARGKDVHAIGAVADQLRWERAGDAVSYVVNRNINFTNICIGSCRFCAFRKRAGDDGAYLMSIEEIVARVKEAKAMGATEVCIQGGLHPDLDIDYYVEMLRSIKATGNSIHVHAFSPMEIHHAARQSDMSARDALMRLKESGLDSIPGTAAEILDDVVRGRICPEKLKSGEWIALVKEAHRAGIPTTATMLYGHVEDQEHEIKHLEAVRQIQDDTGGFTEFVPLSFVHLNTPLYRSGVSRAGASGIEDLLIHAVARIYLDNFMNIQASWVKLGKKFAQVLLYFGANDLGGTLMEENISRSAGARIEMMTREELEEIIMAAGRRPRQRDTLYKFLEEGVMSPRFLRRADSDQNIKIFHRGGYFDEA